jgi:hypothetical protein
LRSAGDHEDLGVCRIEAQYINVFERCGDFADKLNLSLHEILAVSFFGLRATVLKTRVENHSLGRSDHTFVRIFGHKHGSDCARGIVAVLEISDLNSVFVLWREHINLSLANRRNGVVEDLSVLIAKNDLVTAGCDHNLSNGPSLLQRGFSAIVNVLIVSTEVKSTDRAIMAPNNDLVTFNFVSSERTRNEVRHTQFIGGAVNRPVFNCVAIEPLLDLVIDVSFEHNAP